MQEGCVDCRALPRLHELGPCYSETFPVEAPNGVRVQMTLCLCLSCGARFQDRGELREYLRSKLPAPPRFAVA
ncbi:MAG TPA: hypothetical protein VLS93_02255 [Anaeromyxobacteraceae bacterium]|nr:hypothetical protein [Anaeromyxobacteraceae bacterium]